MDPEAVAEKVSSLVSQECATVSKEDYQEALMASIGILQTDLEASRCG